MYRRVILSDARSDARRDQTAWSVRARLLTSSADRLVGIGRSSDEAVLLLTRSIQTFTLAPSLEVAVLDMDGRVISTRHMAPRRVAYFSERRWVIEVRAGIHLPAPGTRIVATTMPERCPEH